jgi:hypothetical protein
MSERAVNQSCQRLITALDGVAGAMGDCLEHVQILFYNGKEHVHML